MVPYIECIDIKMHGMDKLKKKNFSILLIASGVELLHRINTLVISSRA